MLYTKITLSPYKCMKVDKRSTVICDFTTFQSNNKTKFNQYKTKYALCHYRVATL